MIRVAKVREDGFDDELQCKTFSVVLTDGDRSVRAEKIPFWNEQEHNLEVVFEEWCELASEDFDCYIFVKV